MINEQLRAYISERLRAGESVDDLHNAIITIGWSEEDFRDTIGSLPPPLSTFSAVSDPVKSQAQSPIINQNFQSAGNPSHQKIPGFFSLFASGMRIYRERLGTMFGIAVIGVIFSTAVYFVASMAEASFLAGSAGLLSSHKVILGAIVLCVAILSFFVTPWLLLAMMHAICADERIGIWQSLKRSRTQIWSGIWLNLCYLGAFMGYLFVYVLIPIAILTAVMLFIYSQIDIKTAIFTYIDIGIGGVAVLIFLLLITTRFVFAPWLLVGGEQKGISALLASWQYARTQFRTILFRTFGISILFIALSGLFGAITKFIPYAGHTARFLIGTISSNFITIPIVLAVCFSLYMSVRRSGIKPEEFPKKDRNGFIGLAIFGLLIGFALPIGSAGVLASLNHARTTGSDDVVLVNLSTIQIQAMLYDDAHSSYDTANSCYEGMFLNSTIAQAIKSTIATGATVLCRSNGTSYVVYASQSTGGYCVDSAGYMDTLSTRPPEDAFSCMPTATESLQDVDNPTKNYTADVSETTPVKVSEYSIDAPIGWTNAVSSDLHTKTEIFTKEDASIRIWRTDYVYGGTPEKSLDAYMQQKKSGIFKLDSHAQFTNVISTTVDGASARQFDLLWKSSGGDVKVTALIVIHNKYIYDIEGYVYDKDWTTYSDVFANTLTSFTFKN